MNGLELEEIHHRRLQLMIQTQEYQSLVCQRDQIASSAQEGHLAGRAVRQIGATDSKEGRVYRNCAIATEEDRFLPTSVNSVKKSADLWSLKSGLALPGSLLLKV
jgi:hypothetical protein